MSLSETGTTGIRPEGCDLGKMTVVVPAQVQLEVCERKLTSFATGESDRVQLELGFSRDATLDGPDELSRQAAAAHQPSKLYATCET